METRAETDLSNLFSELSDHSSRQVLITGEPGAGKSMMLLECARRSLATSGSNDEDAVPVIAQLSYWTTESLKKSGKKEDLIASFREWLVDQLVETYKVHDSYVRRWLEDGDLELYLDGLDEAPHQARAMCATCLAAFQDAYTGRVFLACRRAEFEELAGNIQPDIVVEVQPLTDAQVTEFVVKNRLAALRRVIDSNEGLFQLSHSPLMLSVMTFVYRTDEDSIEQHVVPTTNGLFAAYVDKAFERRERSKSIYKRISREDTIQAVKLVARSYDFTRNAVFFLSDISSQWFTRRWQKWAAASLLILALAPVVSGLIIANFNQNDGNWIPSILKTIWMLALGAVAVYASIELVPLWPNQMAYEERNSGCRHRHLALNWFGYLAVRGSVGCRRPSLRDCCYSFYGLIWWVLGAMVVGAVALWILTDISPVVVIQAIIGFFAVPYMLLAIVGWITTGDLSADSLLNSVRSALGDNLSESLVWSSLKLFGLSFGHAFAFWHSSSRWLDS